MKSPDPIEVVKQEQAIKDQDEVHVLPPTTELGYGAITEAKTKREAETEPPAPEQPPPPRRGLSLGQLLLVIVCPCRLCFRSN